MVIALTIIHVLMCFAIIAIVLLQSGKGADIGSAFGGAGSQAVFGSMGTPTLLGKITTGVAIVFTLTSFTPGDAGRRARRARSCASRPPAGAPRRRPPARAGHARAPAPPAPRRRRPAARIADAVPAAWSALGAPLALVGAGRRVQRADGRRQRGGRRGANTRAYGDTLHRGLHRQHLEPDPNITSDASSHEVGDLMYNGLVTLRQGPEDRAASWRSRGRSARTASTLDFKLRAGREVARRPAVHGRRRGLHLRGHDQPEDARARTRRTSRPSRRWRRRIPYTVRVDLQAALRQGAAELGR